MANFFTRLAERALGVALTVEPILASMYEPEAGLGENMPLEIELDEEVLDVTHRQDASMPASNSLQHAMHPQHSEASTRSMGEQPAAVIPSASMPLQQKEALASARVSEQASVGPIPSRKSETLLSSPPERQASAASITPLLKTNTAHSEYREMHIHTESVQHRPGKSVQVGATLAGPAEMPTGSQLPPGTMSRQMAPSINPGERTQLNVPPAAAFVHNPGQSMAPVPQIARSSEKKKQAVGEQLPMSTTEPSATTTPAIQVTIGRIEVRATPAPTVVESERKNHAVAPPIMSLDDYLQQRAKGEC
jgi:hypothetical protein